jgi:hypothetical protein
MSSEMMGMRVLVTEDVFLIADMLDEILKERGCEVIGPVAHLDRGLALARDAALDGAILEASSAFRSLPCSTGAASPISLSPATAPNSSRPNTETSSA